MFSKFLGGKVIYTLIHPVPPPLVCNPNGTTISTIVCMQDISSTNSRSIWPSMTEGVAYLLYDSRDEKQYHIAKLADGNIWMLDNLALDPTDPTTAANMNASNTNASAAAITNLLNGGNVNNNDGWSSVAVADVDTGFETYDYFGGAMEPRLNNASKDTLVTSYGAAAINGQAKVGIYYNYCAATASTYCYDDYVPYYYNYEDICPANWRMPIGGDGGDDGLAPSGEFYELGVELGLTYDEDDRGFNGNTYQTALSTSLSGYYWDSSAESQNYYGYWWASFPDNSPTGTYVLSAYAGSSFVAPLSYWGDDPRSGYSIRCLNDGW